MECRPMRLLFRLFGFVLGIVGAALALSMLLAAKWTGALLFAAFALACLPTRRLTGLALPATLRVVLALAALGGAWWWWSSGPQRAKIYDSPAAEAAFESLYEARLGDWPVPYESRMVETVLGEVHVLVAGPADAPPLVLLPAGEVPAWSWGQNVEMLSRTFRIFAIDPLGMPGRSVAGTPGTRIASAGALAAHYAEVMTALGISEADVVGASEGGYAAFSLARFHPDRVRRLVLVAPLGFSPVTEPSARLALAHLFPLRPVEEGFFRWAYGEDRRLRLDIAPWSAQLHRATVPRRPVPWPFGEQDLRAMVRPALVVLGSRDRVLGDPADLRETLAAVPRARVELVDAAHLAAAEMPEEVNALILAFLAAP
jgi:pimeloyl-ACP methyl ester carboxylesterase